MYDVMGIDLPDDLNTQEGEDKFFGSVMESDVVILCANVRQVEFLEAICEYHYSDEKKIIVIGSVIGSMQPEDFPGMPDELVEHIEKWHDAWLEYFADKKKLKKFVTAWSNNEYFYPPATKLQVSLLNFSQLANDHKDESFKKVLNSLPYEKCCELIHLIIEQDVIINAEIYNG
jgi:hypothetical protein